MDEGEIQFTELWNKKLRNKFFDSSVSIKLETVESEMSGHLACLLTVNMRNFLQQYYDCK